MDDEIVSIVERELGEPPVRVAPVDEGLRHETYELGCDGEEYVLQVASDGDEEQVDALERGLNWYVTLQDSEIPVPGVVTEEVREFDGRAYVLVEKLPGKTGERDVSPEKTRDAGRYLAKIHDARSFDTAGRLRFDDREPSVHEFRAGGLKRWIQRRIERRSRVLRDAGLETVGKEVGGLSDQLDRDLPDEFQPVLCHNDYSPDNVLFQDGEVTGILDFDRAYSGHDQRDLVKAANGFWMHDPCSDWDVRATFYEGYREVNALDSSFERNEPLYRAETHAGTIAALLEMGHLSEYEKEFYSETILEAVERVEPT